MNFRQRAVLLLGVTALCVGADQTAKQIAATYLQHSPALSFVGDLFRLQYAENPGSFLSLGAGLPEYLRSLLLVGGLGLFLAALFGYALFSGQFGRLMLVGIAFVLGGGVGNWLDRVLNGSQVIDFMNVGIGPVRSGVFNFADLFIEVGVALVIIASLRAARGQSVPLVGGDGEEQAMER
ncbi:MAG: signal peptidase II [Chloroflexota bacterium]